MKPTLGMCKPKMSNLLPVVFIIMVLFLDILTQISLVNVPEAFSETAHLTNTSQTPSVGSLNLPTQFRPPSQEMSATQNSASNRTCSLTFGAVKLNETPQQTEGPYFVDGMPSRSDIRSDPSTGIVQQGIPLQLVIHVYSVDSGTCTPVSGAKVDIWHANPQGIYSAVGDFGTTDQKFLRGFQTTGNDGSVHFTTVYPGWYQGRTIHIHVKVRMFEGSNKTLEWTSQFYFDNALNKQIHTQLPYSKHGFPTTTNEQDGIYAGPSTDGLIKVNSGQQMLLNVRKDVHGYFGTFNIVLG